MQYRLATQSKHVREATAMALVDLLTVNPLVFKHVLGKMEERQRQELEMLLREALDEEGAEIESEVVKPSISLTFDFVSSV